MTTTIDRARGAHASVFGALQRGTDSWLLGLLARLLFAATLFGYYWNSALTKIGDGFGGIFALSPGAYIQILGFPALDAAGGDPAALPFLSKLIVYAGTYAEFVLPVLVVIGLFGRLSALGTIGFIAVQTVVDITQHGAELGSLFDRMPDGLIDVRLLWVFPLVYLVLRGPGLVSVDALLGRTLDARRRSSTGGAALPAEGAGGSAYAG